MSIRRMLVEQAERARIPASKRVHRKPLWTLEDFAYELGRDNARSLHAAMFSATPEERRPAPRLLRQGSRHVNYYSRDELRAWWKWFSEKDAA